MRHNSILMFVVANPCENVIQSTTSIIVLQEIPALLFTHCLVYKHEHKPTNTQTNDVLYSTYYVRMACV